MSYRLLSRLCLAWSMVVVSPLAPAAYSEAYFFGDSLADAGNNAIVFDGVFPFLPPGTLRTSTPIPAPDFVPVLPYASNRYSNGPVWTEQFAGRLGVSAVPFLAGGTNYAFGGARTWPANSGFPPSVVDQVSFFVQSQGGRLPVDALYVVEAGANDARDIVQAALQGRDAMPLVSGYFQGTFTAITDLQNAGAGHILVANIPDIGRTPEYLARGQTAAQAATTVASLMNDVLSQALATYTPGVRTLDLFGLMDRVIAAPGAYGFTDVTSACAYTPACIADPETTLFWDAIHPTTAGHAVIASAALASINPEPRSLVLVALGLAAVAWRSRSRARRGG